MTDTDSSSTTAVASAAAESLPEKSAEADDPDARIAPSQALVPVAANGQTGNGEVKRNWFWRMIFGRRNGTASLREDLADALNTDTGEAHVFSAGEKAMLNNILRLQDVRVEDLMIPRTDMIAVENTITLGKLLKLFEDSGHSRMPVYGDTLDDPIGMVHIRDVLAYITKTSALSSRAKAARKHMPEGELDLKKVNLEKPLSALKLMRTVLFVPPSMLAVDLLARMQATRTQIALVIDEYGGTEGLVSMEDIVEVIVGDIEDEHDDDENEPQILDKGDGIFLVDAKAELEDIVEVIGDDFQVGDHGEDVDTIGGLVFALIGRVPIRGEVIEGLNFEFRVVDADPRKIKKIELARSKRRRVRKSAEA